MDAGNRTCDVGQMSLPWQ